MGYMHIDNLYKSQDILLFKECYALEKVHGTSAFIKWEQGKPINFHAGCVSHDKFIQLFDEAKLTALFESMGHEHVKVHGEAYGGKVQGMSSTYGPHVNFIVFDIRVGHFWLSVLDMEKVAQTLGFEVVPYRRIPTTIEALDQARDEPSEVAFRRGCGSDKKREGVVLRPLIELTKNNGRRIIVKHRIYEYSERKTPQNVTPEALAILNDAADIANEWVTPMRLTHVLDKFPGANIEQAGDIVHAMIEDVYREASGEIVPSKAAAKAIGKKTMELFKLRLKEGFHDSTH